MAEAAFLTIDPLKEEEEQEIATEDGKCEEDSERHNGYRCLQEKNEMEG